MSHLGERASALIDGELRHAERERALAHLTICADCRAEVESIRALKSRLRSLDRPSIPVDLTLSLLRMSEPGGPVPPRERPFPRTFEGVPIPGPHSVAPVDNRPRKGPFGTASGPGRGSRRRSSYVAVGMVSAAVALGTFFVVVGQDNGPRVNPPVPAFNELRPRSTPSGGPAVTP